MSTRHVFRSLPGLVATILATLMATAAAVTGTASLFYEAWGQPLPRMPKYLAPAAVLMAAGLVALRWPRAGGALLLVGGVGGGGWWLRMQLGRGLASFESLVFQALVMTTPVILAALLFLFEARHRRLLREEGAKRPRRWIARNWRSALLIFGPLAGIALLAAQQLPALLARHDDGLRGVRVIESGGATLAWAPKGPGWNARQSDNQYPAWRSIAGHGQGLVELCAYLNEEGTALLDKPVYRWRMPTVQEIIGALSRGGANAGCTWDGRSPHAVCRTPPDKETPLWAPDESPIYYWSGQEASDQTAFAVNYTGGISVLPASTAELGVGFRCVKPAGGGAAVQIPPAILQQAPNSDERGVPIEALKRKAPALEAAFASHVYKNAKGEQMPYRLYTPARLEPGRTYPLVVFLHGAGGSGTDNLKQLKGANMFGALVWTLPENQAQHPAFVLAPQSDVNWPCTIYDPKNPPKIPADIKFCPPDVLGIGARMAFEIVDGLLARLPIDRERIYVTGHSMGGAGTWHMIAHRPGFFAAAVPVCGHPVPSTAPAVKDVPIWNFHGTADDIEPVTSSRIMIDALRKAGGRPLHTEYAGVGHNVFMWAYTEPALVDWLFAQRLPPPGERQ